MFSPSFALLIFFVNFFFRFPIQTRKAYAAKLKAAGNKAFGSKDYNKAIDLYGKAIICKPDPVYYSNRAACYNVLSEWEKVVEDTSAAIAMNSEYVKALNRRAIAYEHLEKFSEALLDFTASCIIDGFSNETSRVALERLLKKVAEQKSKAILAAKGKKLPSPTFVSNYLQSFRPKPLPEGLDESADLSEDSGKGQLRKGFLAMAKKTGDGYEEAAAAFEKALELGDLGDFEALALNMRATFTYLEGDAPTALNDLNKSVELQPSLVQSYIKRASLHLELGILLLSLLILTHCVAANKAQETRTLQRTTLSLPLLTTRTIPISTITVPSSTSSWASLPMPRRTTRSRSTSIAASSTLTSSWV